MLINKKMLFMVIVIVLSNFSWVYAQGKSNLIFVSPRSHYVEWGDNTWDIAEGDSVFANGFSWKQIQEMNPFLEDGRLRRFWKDSLTQKWMCELYPGEKIYLGHEVVTPIIQRDTVSLVEPIKIEDYPLPVSHWWDSLWGFLFFMLCALLLALLVRYFVNRKDRESNPVGGGEPQVPGGVNDDRATKRMIDIAASHLGFDPGILTVFSKEKGTFRSGRARVYYADKPNGKIKRFNNERGYRGQVRKPDGSIHTVYFLQGCGNDVVRGNYFLGDIDFAPDAEQPESFRVQAEAASSNEASQELSTEDSSQVKEDLTSRTMGVIETLAKNPDKKVFFDAVIAPDGTVKLRYDTSAKPRPKA